MKTVIIKPYVTENTDHMGLNKLGLNAFPKTYREFPVPIKNGRYLTGLDPHAAYLIKLTPEEREKELARIKTECDELNKLYPTFKLCDCSLDNEYYSNMTITIGADNTYLNVDMSLEDRIKYSVIKTMAKYSTAQDSIIANSLADLLSSNKNYKYYISDEEVDAEEEVSTSRKRNKAIKELEELFDKDKSKALLVLKYIMKADRSYNRMSEGRRYKLLQDYIDGIVNGVNTKASKAEEFSKVIKLKKEDLTFDIVVKYAEYLNIIRFKPDSKEYYYTKTGMSLGRSLEEVKSFLKITKNSDVYEDIKENVNDENSIL